MKLHQLWSVIEVVAFLAMIGTVIAAVLVLTRPHSGQRGPVHWEAATILLFVSLGCDLIASIAHVTHKELHD